MIRILRWPVLIALVGLALLAALLAGLAWRQPVTEVPDYGGAYTEALVGRPRTLSPLFIQTDTERDLVCLLFRGLTRADASGAIVPDAAQDWGVSRTGLVYTFRLRDDVFWSDGVPLTARDVLFTISTIQDPAFAGRRDLADVWRLVQVEALDERTVRFTLSEPFAPFLDQTTLGLLPAHILEQIPVAELAAHPFSQQPVGNGPFRLEKIDDASATLAPNPHDGDRHPYLGRITFRFFPDHGAALAAYLRKDVMGIGRLSANELSKVAANNGALYSAPRPAFTVVYLNHDRFMFQDRRTRQALMLGLDRPTIVRQALNGQGLVADSPIIARSWAYDPGIRRYDYDPARAASLLESAGWVDKDGDGVREREGLKLEFSLATSDDPTRQAVAVLLAKQWAAIGVRVRVQAVAPRQLEQVYLQPRLFDAALYGWEAPDADPDPYPLWHSTQVGDGQNFGGWANLEADSRLEEARKTVDPAGRAVLYRDFQTIFAEEIPALLLYHGVYHYAVDNQVHNVQLGSVMLDPSARFQTIQQWYVRTKSVRPGLLDPVSIRQ